MPESMEGAVALDRPGNPEELQAFEEAINTARNQGATVFRTAFWGESVYAGSVPQEEKRAENAAHLKRNPQEKIIYQWIVQDDYEGWDIGEPTSNIHYALFAEFPIDQEGSNTTERAE